MALPKPHRPETDEDDSYPLKLVYPLEHAYTQAELGFRALKGRDAGVASVVCGAAQAAGCAIQLALLTVEENGPAEYHGDWRRGRRRYYDDDEDEDDDEGTTPTTTSKSSRSASAYATLSDWRTPDGSPSELETLPAHDQELSPPDVLETLKPDEAALPGSVRQ